MDAFKEAWRAGHFYSVLPDAESIRKAAIRDESRLPDKVTGIDTREAEQLALLDDFAKLAPAFPYLRTPLQEGLRYQTAGNRMFPAGDALVLHCFLRHFRPRRLVEIGSGFSSAVSLDTNQFFLERSLRMTFIEPYPERLAALLRDEDRSSCSIHASAAQEVPVSVFAALERGDILFVDSSHVGKAGSDLLHILFEILPRLPSGCFVHFHDIFWPFEYPMKWYEGGRAWNEAYFIRTLLSANSLYRIVFHNHFMASVHRRRMAESLPAYFQGAGGSLYLVKQ